MAKIKKADGLISASIIILFAYAIFNISNFLYHFLSARMLGPAEYSVVASLFSIVYLISIASTTIQNTTTKFTAEFNAKAGQKKVSNFFRKGLKKLSLASIAVVVVYLLMSPLIANFLKIPITPVLLLSPMIIISFLIPLNRGILQGLQNFNRLATNVSMEGIIKLVAALLLIFLGFKANGVILGASIGIIIAFIFSFSLLKFEKGKKKSVKLKIDSKEIYEFTIISFIALFLITAIYSIDVFLVKHFFSAELAGHYAALSLLGKIIFFGATSIGVVMFPKISEMHAKNQDKTGRILKKAALFTLLLSVLGVAVYFVFSKLIVGIVFGADYSEISPLLGLFAIFMASLSLSYIFVLHKLAIGKKRFIWNLLIAVILEIILISLFHDSLIQIIWILIALNLILFASLLIKK